MMNACAHRSTVPDPDYNGSRWGNMQESMRVCEECGTCVQHCDHCQRAYALRGCPARCEHGAEDRCDWCRTCDRCAACCQEKPGPLTTSDMTEVIRFIALHMTNRSIECRVAAAATEREAADVVAGSYGTSSGGWDVSVTGRKITARFSHRTGSMTALDAARMIRRRPVNV